MQKTFDRKVIDFVLPLKDFKTIPYNATVFDAVTSMEQLNGAGSPMKRCSKSLLVVDDNDRVIGKIGPLCCLKAMKSDFCLDFDDIEKIRRLEDYHSDFLEDLLCKKILEQCTSLKKQTMDTSVINVMYTINESIDGNASIFNAINKIINFEGLTVLVTIKSEVIGLLHIIDLYNELSSFIDFYKNSKFMHQ